MSLAEPALALTLPEATDEDDGLLTASEVAQLKLNADWVVLSACNTAAGDKPGAEALSGLARAFFYAGARALLVSNWPVESDAAVRLTTGTFDALQADHSIGRSEALRRAIVAMIDDTGDQWNAYPAFWAPFMDPILCPVCRTGPCRKAGGGGDPPASFARHVTAFRAQVCWPIMGPSWNLGDEEE